MFRTLGTKSSAGMSSHSNVCHLGVSSTSEMVLASLCLVLGEHALEWCWRVLQGVGVVLECVGMCWSVLEWYWSGLE